MTIVTPQTHEAEKGAARQFWDQQMERHPTLHGILSIISSTVEFFTGGHFIVRLGQKVVLTGGVIAETSLLFATLWVTADYTIPAFLRKFMSLDLMNSFSSLSQAAFSLLPEIILASAIVTTIHHWKIASTNWNNKHWIWASLFTAPTLTFLVLTLYTISTFTSQDGSIAQATGAALAIRCFAGYSYALLELIYARIGKHVEQVVSQQEHLKTVEELHAEHKQYIANLERQHQQALTELTERQERRLGLIDLQQQRLLTTVQEVGNSVPAIDPEALVQTVSAQFETHLQTKIEAFLSQRVTVSPALETPKIAAPRNVSSTHKRDSRAGKTTLAARVKPEFDGDPETVVYRLLDEDRSRSHRAIAKMTGIPDTTVYRIRKRYLEEHGNAVSSKQEDETAM